MWGYIGNINKYVENNYEEIRRNIWNIMKKYIGNMKKYIVGVMAISTG